MMNEISLGQAGVESGRLSEKCLIIRYLLIRCPRQTVSEGLLLKNEAVPEP
jgi:hypothetical protein